MYSPFYDESIEMKPYLENDEACLDAYLSKSKEEGKSDVQIAEISGKILLCNDLSIQKNSDTNIIIVSDVRNSKLGSRVIIFDNQDLDDFDVVPNSLEKYNKLRIENKIIDGAYDLIVGKSIILEYGYQNIPAISFDKGCYLGQELMNRTHRLGVIRKFVYSVETEDTDQEIVSGSEILHHGKKVGLLCSYYKDKGKIKGIGLLKIDRVKQQSIKVTINNNNHKYGVNALAY